MKYSNPFSINCTDSNTGLDVKVIFDPYQGIFNHEDGTPVVPTSGLDTGLAHPLSKKTGMYTDEREENPTFSPKNPKKKTSDVKTLKIQMGLKCNYSCSYCGQATHLENGEAFDTDIEDAEKFLAGLDSWLTSAPESIEFWGGEPLVYIKKLRVMIPALREKFPEARFGIITNGALLNDSITEFILSHGVTVSMSHDGPGQHLRGPDPFDDPVVVKNVKLMSERMGRSFSINVVITSINHDPIKIREWFEDKLQQEIAVNFEGVVAAHDTELQGSALFDDASYLSMQAAITNALINGSDKDIAPFWPRLKSFASALINHTPANGLGQKCGMDKEDYLATDLLGNVMTCQNVGPNSKHLLGSTSDISAVRLNTAWHWSEREECSHCPVVQICQGGCMYLEGNEFAETCNNEFNYAKPIFDAVLFNWYGLIVKSIDGDIRRPKVRRIISIKAA